MMAAFTDPFEIHGQLYRYLPVAEHRYALQQMATDAWQTIVEGKAGVVFGRVCRLFADEPESTSPKPAEGKVDFLPPDAPSAASFTEPVTPSPSSEDGRAASKSDEDGAILYLLEGKTFPIRRRLRAHGWTWDGACYSKYAPADERSALTTWAASHNLKLIAMET